VINRKYFLQKSVDDSIPILFPGYPQVLHRSISLKDNLMPSAVERNREPILQVLKQYLSPPARVLEIGSGGAGHAIYFSEFFNNIQWVTSDVKENHPQITNALKKAMIKNLHGPETLKIGVDDFPKGSFDYVFSANTLHIMSWKQGKSLFKLLGKRLREGSLVFLYGPFNYDGKYTSPSNEVFDKCLKERDSKSGIRNSEDVFQSMQKYGFKLLKDHEMPANNRLLVFERLAFQPS